MTLTLVGWIDLFTFKCYNEIVINSLRYCIKNKGLNLYAFCLMTNHLHLIANSNHPFVLKDTIRDFKKFTSKQLVTSLQEEKESRRSWILNMFAYSARNSKKHKNFQVWQAGNHAIELFNQDFTWNKVHYIHQNPVKTGFVNSPDEWRYSSASNYFERKDSVLNEVICLSQPMRTVK